MTKVLIQRADDEDHNNIAELNLDIIPRIGESICILEDGDLPIDHGWHVLYVTHTLRTIHGRFVEPVVILTIQYLKEAALNCFIEWQDESTRPSWISDEMWMECEVAPRQGDIILIGINDERYTTKDGPIAVVEVIAVMHNTLLVPFGGDPMIESGQTTFAAIVRNVDYAPTGEMQRVMASRRN